MNQNDCPLIKYHPEANWCFHCESKVNADDLGISKPCQCGKRLYICTSCMVDKFDETIGVDGLFTFSEGGFHSDNIVVDASARMNILMKG